MCPTKFFFINLYFINKAVNMFNLSVLPSNAQNELIDFYEFLLQKYANEKANKVKDNRIKADLVNNFFDNYNLEMKDYSFNRNEIYEP